MNTKYPFDNRRSNMDQREIAVRAAKALDAKRAKDIIVLKVD